MKEAKQDKKKIGMGSMVSVKVEDMEEKERVGRSRIYQEGDAGMCTVCGG